MYNICPVFNIDQAILEINRLPSEISISENPQWIPIIDTDYHSGLTRLSGIQYTTGEVFEKGPVVESLDNLEEYVFENADQLKRIHSIFENKILIINSEDWIRQAKEGEISEITALGKNGWMLVSTFLYNESMYCVFQKEYIIR